MTLSIRARLTLWFIALMTVALTAFSVGVMWWHMRAVRAQFDVELTGIGAEMASVMREELGESGNLRRAVAETRSSMDVPGRATAILDAEGESIAAEWRGFDYGGPTRQASIALTPGAVSLRDAGGQWRILLRHESSPAGDYTILVGGTTDQIERQQYLLARILLVATPLLVLVAAGVCWWVASSALRPVTVMAAQAEAITASSTDRRLAPPTTSDELAQFARAFNRLLDRLGTALQLQRQFMADASHELRTPVSAIQTAAEVTLQRQGRDEAEYREALTIVSEQSTRLGRMVADMFVLARADAGGGRLTVRPLYLDEVVAECVRAAALLATANGIHLVTSIQPEIPLSADDGLLHQLVANLIDNAVRYTREGGTVTVSVTADRSEAIVAVADTGPGIAPADRERVFDRFVRLDPARARASGAGLGLPIARWVAEQHGGTLTLEPGGAGCVFVVRLPMNASAH